MNILVNFSNDEFKKSRLELNESAKRYGIEKIASYDESAIRNTVFFKENFQVFQHQKGFGYWLWKPYLIERTLNESSEGDIIVYSDSGIKIIADLAPLFKICERKNIVLFANGNLKNRYWTKRDCFVLTDADERKFWDGPQADAAFCLFKNCSESKIFVDQWLEFCRDIRIIGDEHNVLGKPNFFGFRRHRNDQSVLSILAQKNHLELFRQPTQFGNHYKMPELRIAGERNCISQHKTRQVNYYSKHPYSNSPYFQLLDHHRKKATPERKEKVAFYKQVFISGRRRFKKIIKLITRQ